MYKLLIYGETNVFLELGKLQKQHYSAIPEVQKYKYFDDNNVYIMSHSCKIWHFASCKLLKLELKDTFIFCFIYWTTDVNEPNFQ